MATRTARSFLQGKIDGGVLLLSRFPIVASDVYKFNRGLHADRYAHYAPAQGGEHAGLTGRAQGGRRC